MFANNRKSFAEKIKNGIAVLYSGNTTSHPNSMKEISRCDSNFYYVTGLNHLHTIALVTIDQYVLFCPSPDPVKSLWEGKMESLEEIKQKSGADEVFDINLLEKKLPQYFDGKETLYYCLGKDANLDNRVLSTLNAAKRKSKKLLPYNIWDVNDIIQEMRIIKSPFEIEKIKHAVAITAKAFQSVFESTQPGFFEYQIEACLHHTYTSNGCTNAFPAIVGSSANATVLHYHANDRQIQSGDLILVDSGAEYQHYCADVSRVWPVNKKFTDSQKSVYTRLLKAQKEMIKNIKPGVKISDWIDQTNQMMAQCMIDLDLLNGSVTELIESNDYKKYYPHSIGHWLGLDVHDLGGMYRRGTSRIFEPGMVLTVEPGIYIPTNAEDVPSALKGIGIRLEDDILVTEQGHENLTKDIPIDTEFFEE